MSWLNEHRNVIRATALLLFLLAMAGPWMFDRIYVPAEYECSAPNVRLEGDFCGLPMSGINVFTWFWLGLISNVAQLLTTTRADSYSPRLLEYLATLFFAFPLLTFVTNLVVMLKQGSQRLQTTTTIFWGIACLLTLLFLISGLGPQAAKLWGLWIYIALTLGMTVFELLALVNKSAFPYGASLPSSFLLV